MIVISAEHLLSATLHFAMFRQHKRFKSYCGFQN